MRKERFSRYGIFERFDPFEDPYNIITAVEPLHKLATIKIHSLNNVLYLS